MIAGGRLPISRDRVVALVVLVALGLGWTTPAMAWGRWGHRAAGKLAESRLTPTARSAVQALLGTGVSLADASTWADEVRRDRPESSTWHYINIPITESKVNLKYCQPEGCVIGKIADFRAVLADTKAPREQRVEALKFLAHLVEDMHNPVHVGDRRDRGGNDCQVQFFDKGSNLHRVWDSGMIEHGYPDEDALLVAMLADSQRPEAAHWGEGTVEDWAGESLDEARRAYVELPSGRPMKSGSKLGDAYQQANLPVARVRLAQSGVRLATILNGIFTTAP